MQAQGTAAQGRIQPDQRAQGRLEPRDTPRVWRSKRPAFLGACLGQKPRGSPDD